MCKTPRIKHILKSQILYISTLKYYTVQRYVAKRVVVWTISLLFSQFFYLCIWLYITYVWLYIRICMYIFGKCFCGILPKCVCWLISIFYCMKNIVWKIDWFKICANRKKKNKIPNDDQVQFFAHFTLHKVCLTLISFCFIYYVLNIIIKSVILYL